MEQNPPGNIRVELDHPQHKTSSQLPAINNVDEDFEIIDRSAIESSVNDLVDENVLFPSNSKNLRGYTVGSLASTMTDVLQLPTSPPRKDTPILPNYRHGDIAPVNVVRLDTPPSLVTQGHGTTDVTSEIETGEATAVVDSVLHKAYSTVIESSNRPVGHRSSPSLRHIVFSSRTTSTLGLCPSKESQEDVNSSTESFVKITPPEISPDRAAGGAASSVLHAEGTSSSQHTAQQLGPYDCSKHAATLEEERLTIGGGRSTHKEAVIHALPESVPRTATSNNDVSPPESSVFVHGTLPTIPSLSLLFLLNLPSTASSAAASSDNLAQSYNSAEDPNNLKYWWNAGIRDGDPAGSPLSRDSPPSRQSSNVIENEFRDEDSPADADQVAAMSISQAIAQALEDDCGDQPTFEEAAVSRRSRLGRDNNPHAREQIYQGDSDENVERGRELKSSLSDDVLFKGRATIENALLGAVSEEADGAAARTNIEDAGGSSTWLQPLEMLLHEAPDLDLNSLSSQSMITSRLHVKDGSKSLSSVPFSSSSNRDVGILLPEKHVERSATPSAIASVDPSNLHISYETRPWDPLVSGVYVTFKFLLYLLANTLRCQPQQLPYHPVTSYIARFSMVPEMDLRQLFSNELSYAVVTDHHITHHDLFLWYKQIFRTTQDSSGTFQACISAIIQVGLEYTAEPIEYTLQKLQSNPKIICLLPPGGCSVHDGPEDYSELDAERRPHTSYGSTEHMARNRHLPSWTPKDIIVEIDTFAYDIKEDLDLSSSSDSSLRLCSSDDAFEACSSDAAHRDEAQIDTDINTAARRSTAEVNQRLIEITQTPGTRNKGKARAIREWESGSVQGYIVPPTISAISLPDVVGLSTSSAEHPGNVELIFSVSKWNLFNRVLGLLSNVLGIPWNDVLKDPRCVHTLVHEAGVSVDTFERWVQSAGSEEKAEREEAKRDPNYQPWRALADPEGRWHAPSYLAAMHQISQMKSPLSQVSQMAPFQRALLQLVRLCDRNLERQPVEETYNFLANHHGFLNFEPWSIPNATRTVIRNLKSHLESASGDYLAPEAKEELKEFVRVQELQIGSSSKDWQGDEAMDVLQSAQLMMG